MNRLSVRDYVLAVVIFVIAFTFFLNFLHIPEPRSFRDEGQFFYGAERILEGQLIYRDFHEIQYPGSFYLLAALFSVFGSRLETGRVFTYILVASGVAIYFLIIRTVVRSLLFSFTPVLVIVFFGFPQWPGSLPHWFSFFTNALSIFLLHQHVIRKKISYSFFAGVFSGISFSIIQNEGIFLFAAGILFLWIHSKFFISPEESKVKLSPYFFTIGFLIIGLIPPVYFLIKGAFFDFMDSTFFYLFKNYLPANKIPEFGYFTSIVVQNLISKIEIVKGVTGIFMVYGIIAIIYFIQYGLILIYGLSFSKFLYNWFTRHIRESEMSPNLLLLIIAGVFLFFSQIHKPDPVRIMFVSFPGLILTSNLVESTKGIIRTFVNLICLSILIVIFIYSFGIIQDFKKYNCVVNTEGGQIYFNNYKLCDELNDLQRFVKDLLKEDRRVYIHNWEVQYYFLFKLKNPVSVDGLLMGHNSLQQYQSSLAILKHHPPEIILTDRILEMMIKDPTKGAMPTLSPEVLKNDPIWEFIKQNYTQLLVFPASGLTLWKRSSFTR